MTDKKSVYTLFLAILLLTVAQFNSDLYLPSMPAMIDALNTDMAHVQMTVVAAMIAFGAALLVWGPLSDYYGRRFVALSGTGVFLLGSLVCSTAQTIEMVLVGRVLQGAGMSCAGAVAPAIPKDIFKGTELIRAFSVISMAMAVMPMIAQVLGGYLQAIFGWRANFIFLSGYGLIIFGCLYQLLPETNATVRQQPIVLSRLLRDYVRVCSDRAFIGYLLCMTLIFGGEATYLIAAPFVLQQQLGISEIQNGWLAIFTGGGLLIGALLSSYLAKNKDIKELIFIGLPITFLATAAMLILARLEMLSVFTFVAPVVLFMVGAGLIYPNCIAGIMNRFPSESGIAGALMSSFQMLGASVVGAIISANALNTPIQLSRTFLVISLLTALSFWVFVRPQAADAVPAAGAA